MRIIQIVVIVGVIIFTNSCKEEPPSNPESFFTLNGRILDSENDSPIIGASVRLNEIEDSTDLDGYFSFKGLMRGDFTLLVTHRNYNKYFQSISISRDTVVNIKLFIEYSDFLPLDIGQKKYSYSYEYEYPPPRPGYEKRRSISTWTINDILSRNDTIVYKVLETRIDTVERAYSHDFTGHYQDTISQEFEIYEDVNHIISSNKFPGITFPRYGRSDLQKNKYYSSNYKMSIVLIKNIGIYNIEEAWYEDGYSKLMDYILLE